MGLFGKPKDLVGLDIGSHSIKLVEFKQRGKNFELVSFGIQPLPPDSIVEGAIMDSSAVADAIDSLFVNNNVKRTEVATSVSGGSVIVKKISLPTMSEGELSESIRWEAEQYIPFPIDEVNLDHKILRTTAGQGGMMDIILVAVKKDMIGFYANVITQAGKRPLVVDVDSFAMQNAFELNYKSDVRSDEVIALINVGASLINMNIIQGEISLFTRDIGTGGNLYTETIQRELNLSRDNAENIKKGIPTDGIEPSSAASIIQGVTEDIAVDVQRTLDFFKATSTEERIDRIYIAGGSAKIPGLQQYFREKFNAPTELLNPFKNIKLTNIDADYLHEVAPVATVAVGLALRKAGDS
ncbi:MAG TPA: type IV pilus assembly protein PilM [Acidobacteriota bacterium]|nr:type IV pilus assembly protein PilM [Acidobacteriota bacterium]